jgi:hypothetical protein
LTNEVQKIQKELDFAKEQMLRKNDEYQSTIDDLAAAQRAAEDGRLNAIQEVILLKGIYNNLSFLVGKQEIRIFGSPISIE